MKLLLSLAASAGVLMGQSAPPISSLVQVKRIYVAPLTGGPSADALRDLIIAGVDSTKLFVLTDNPDRADAVLKGAAEEHSYEDTFDSSEGISSRENGGKYGSGSSSSSSKAGGGYGGLSLGDVQSRHIKERKHEAYATVRLCNSQGDVLWSTTQESPGAKFRGAGADVANRIARQLSLDFDRARRESSAPPTAKP